MEKKCGEIGTPGDKKSHVQPKQLTMKDVSPDCWGIKLSM
jgi:hypothetical protein